MTRPRASRPARAVSTAQPRIGQLSIENAPAYAIGKPGSPTARIAAAHVSKTAATGTGRSGDAKSAGEHPLAASSAVRDAPRAAARSITEVTKTAGREA